MDADTVIANHPKYRNDIMWNKVSVILTVTLLLMSGYVVTSPGQVTSGTEFSFYARDGSDGGVSDGGDGGGGDDEPVVVIDDGFSVQVPDFNIQDQAKYEYSGHGEIHYENTSSGDFFKATIDASGEFTTYIGPVKNVMDGYGQMHDSMWKREETSASVTVRIQQGGGKGGSGGEDLTVRGYMYGNRIEYKDLGSGKPIQAVSEAELSVSGFPISFDIELNSFFDPNAEMWESIDDQIYGKGQRLSSSSKGVVRALGGDGEDGTAETNYIWDIDRAEDLRGYDTLKLDIKTDLFGYFAFNRSIWLADGVSVPIRYKTSTTSYESDEAEGGDSSFTTSITFTRTLVQGGYQRGNSPIPWNLGSTEFLTQHEDGDFEYWSMAPSSGSDFDDSAVAFDIQTAISIARTDSSGLRKFLAEHDSKRVMIQQASYNTTEIDDRKVYIWNLTFGHYVSREERETWDQEDWRSWPDSYYRVAVALEDGRSATQAKVLHDIGLRKWGPGPLDRLAMEDKVLTMRSAERIISDLDVMKESSGVQDGRFVINEKSHFSIEAQEDSADEGLNIQALLQNILGINIPTMSYSYNYAYGGDLETPGETVASASVDARTGRVVMIMKLKSEASAMGAL